MIFVEEGWSSTIFFNQDLVISSNLYHVDIWWWALELQKLLTTIELHAFHEESRMFSITFTKWQQQQVLQMALQVNLNSLDSIAIFLQAFTNPTYKWNNKFKEIMYRKQNLKCMRNSEGTWYYFPNIIILGEDNMKLSSPHQKNKGNHKVVDLDCVKIKARKPIHTHYENFKILAFNNAKKVKHVKLTWKLLIKETIWIW